jgi:hypothetical protein
MDEVRIVLRAVASRKFSDDISELKTSLAEHKKTAVQVGDQTLAKEIWCLEETLDAQAKYLEAFQQLKKADYYGAWCTLEQAELAIGFLRPHFQSEWATYKLDRIEEYVRKWQGLFPYKIFFSPEIVEIEKTCSICNKPVSLRNHCGHEVGEIYNGEMCCRIISKVEFLGTATVSSPVQKYSVPFIVDPKTGQQRDHYNYTLVKYAAQRIEDPFLGWSCTWTKRRHPHSRYRHVGRNDKCPCESGKKYKHCCLKEEGVLRPHVEFDFQFPLPPHLQTLEFTD